MSAKQVIIVNVLFPLFSLTLEMQLVMLARNQNAVLDALT